MKQERSQQVHRPFNFAIVDEVDSILIDEARTPLIISGPTEDKSDLYIALDALVKTLPKELYEADEKTKNVQLTEDGFEHVEQQLIAQGVVVTDNLYDIENTMVVHHLNEALRANVMFKRDIDYIIKDDKVVIIDEFTGRMIGPLAARYGEARVIVLGLALLALSMLLQPVIRMPVAGVLLMGLLMMGHSLAFPSAGALISRNIPPDRQGGTMGLMMASNAVGRIIAPPLFGLIYERFGHDAPWYAGAATIALIVLVALQAVRLSVKS